MQCFMLSKRELHAANEAASRKDKDGSGGQVMVWVKNRESIVPGHVVDNVVDYDDDGSPRAFASYRPTQIYEYQVWRAFWVNSSGTIYRWEWQGE